MHTCPPFPRIDEIVLQLSGYQDFPQGLWTNTWFSCSLSWQGTGTYGLFGTRHYLSFGFMV